MVRQTGTVPSYRRRNVLRLAGATGGLGVLAARGVADDETDHADGETFALRQAGECAQVTPLSGDEPIEQFYQYTYPTSVFEGPPGVAGSSYSSEGTVDLQRERGSVLFLYEGPEGYSLVFVHGRHDEEEAERPAGESDAGGAVSARVCGLPEAGRWVVLDDYYAVDGEQSESNFDRYDIGGDCDVLHWLYRGGRTDGGVFRGLEGDLDVEVAAGFNDRAGLSEVRDYGTVERWEFLSGDLEDPERLPLAMDRPVRITSGGCDGERSG